MAIPTAPDHIAGARVVAAYKGGSKDIPESINRVDQVRRGDPHASTASRSCPTSRPCFPRWTWCCSSSVDGRVHLEQAKPVIAAHKPLFIDKPLASTLEDAREIARLAKAAGVPWFSSSSLRFGAIGTTMKFPDAHRRAHLGTRAHSKSTTSWIWPGTPSTRSSCCTP